MFSSKIKFLNYLIINLSHTSFWPCKYIHKTFGLQAGAIFDLAVLSPSRSHIEFL